ncbi:uncharacterized protein FOMMEDRAFT_16290 [Fomitiporia mediterranea MF3/22]|uniref:uncharacterized protein n=1 Tax=Fomitiporia mediterranea (strain MF3/22) TaxID=694068 RepID=UPI0004407ED6|nr:uncharacterized protein FOMMEDRAFT_16290 [Fomitiporia mediterranea MF3/22]EJD07659.1 hypothetical protein FOMMEDRAFT_16290 [Fomitiporia mediterranea MF3/22]
MADMAELEIFTALNVPTPGPQPSISCVQWSGDGQLILSTKSAIYILTPDLGINFDSLSLLKTDRRNFQENGSKEPGLDLGWHRNLIELEKTISHPWPSETQEYGAVNLGSLDVSWRSVAVSPGNLSNVSTGSSCVLVTLNTNLELTLWSATKNHLKEAWSKTQDITSALKELPSPEDVGPEGRNLYLKTLQAQVNCMAWSQQADFGAHPNPLADGSILALGNRAGSIILLRHDGKQSLEPFRVIRIADDWITHLTWNPWRSPQPFLSECYLACGLANGTIAIVYVRQRLELIASTAPFGPAFTVHTEFNVLDDLASGADEKGISALAWVDRAEVSEEKPTLFHAKPGSFRFFQLSTTGTDMNTRASSGRDLGTLCVQVQKTSVDSSSLYPVSGLGRVRALTSDTLIVTLFDGSFHVVQDACSSPRLDSTIEPRDAVHVGNDTETHVGNNSLTSTNLSCLARATFVEAEGSAVQQADIGRISGAVNFDGFGTILWIHETCKPTLFTYKHDAKHNCMIIVAKLWRSPTEHDMLLNYITEMFRQPRSVLCDAPASKLRPILLHLCQRRTFDTVWPRVLELLSSCLHAEETLSAIGSWSGRVTDDIRLAFRRSLAIDFYGWDAYHSLRLRLAVADYCWKMSPSEEIREQFGRIAQTLLGNISHRFMKVLVRHLTAVIEALTEKELPFLMRVIVQSLLEGSPPDLSVMAQALSDLAKNKFTDAAPEAFGLTETCPACSSPIPLENLLTAVCPMGHAWARCSITSFILSTPLVRTCSGCTRKAFLPPSSRVQNHNSTAAGDTLCIASSSAETMTSSAPPSTSNLWIPEAGRSWIVDELLEAARYCLYCGNRFVRIL